MLSKVAERIYWTARYLERVESTARIVSIYDKLLFDLPRDVNLTWFNLVIINDLESDYLSRYTVQDERNVVKFLLGDDTNPSSIVSSLHLVRENVRTTRDVVLEETWELVNELNMYVHENIQHGINRSKRHEFLEFIIKGCQQILGLLYGNMPHDSAWDFLRLGRNLERADMTTRNLDAGIAAIIELESDDSAINSRQIIWGTVLRSLNADQSYRRDTRSAVRGELVVEYLLKNMESPRALAHCLDALCDTAEKLPGSKPLLTHLNKVQQKVTKYNVDENLNGEFRNYLNDLQIKLASVHRLIAETWFPHV